MTPPSHSPNPWIEEPVKRGCQSSRAEVVWLGLIVEVVVVVDVMVGLARENDNIIFQCVFAKTSANFCLVPRPGRSTWLVELMNDLLIH